MIYSNYPNLNPSLTLTLNLTLNLHPNLSLQRAIEEQMVQTVLASLDIDTLPLMQALLRAINDASQMEQSGYFSSLVDRLTDSHHMGTPTIAEFTQMITGLLVSIRTFNNIPYQRILSTHALNTPYQHILSTRPIIIPYQHILATHPINTS